MDATDKINEIRVTGLYKSFGDLEVLNDVDFDINRDEVIALIGPSGSGKSTFLRCLNLLEIPDSGEIVWEGKPVKYKEMTPNEMAAHRANMGMVFQHFHLFPHRRALENVMEGPVQVLGTPKEQARREGMELLDLVGLSDKYDAWPSQLSGGQKQRVAIARALAMEPKVLLLDEVTSALDVEMISGINDLLAGIAEKGMTMVIVTHDLMFARRIADGICFMDEGRIIESATPEKILSEPKSERLKEFLSAVRYAVEM
jgi:ABC-type polar amino acid transport system ATPase subunit